MKPKILFLTIIFLIVDLTGYSQERTLNFKIMFGCNTIKGAKYSSISRRINPLPEKDNLLSAKIISHEENEWNWRRWESEHKTYVQARVGLDIYQ